MVEWNPEIYVTIKMGSTPPTKSEAYRESAQAFETNASSELVSRERHRPCKAPKQLI